MRIEQLNVHNFKGFGEYGLTLHPEFTLIVGKNGSGKTSLLEALCVAAGSWFLGIRDAGTRHIQPQDIRLKGFSVGSGVNWELQFPCSVGARGTIQGQVMTWTRALNSRKGRTTYGGAKAIKVLAFECDEAVRGGARADLPLIAYYGTGRTVSQPREDAVLKDVGKIRTKTELSRFSAYRSSLASKVSVADLVEWIARESWSAFQAGGVFSPAFVACRTAIIRAIEGAREIVFDAKFGEVIVAFENDDRQPFSNLSAGQKNMFAIVGDMARIAATLNPHLGEGVLAETSGIVLIDELDLHLHPRWQRHVVEDLRAIFPKIQFICTTHSPW